MRIKVNYNGLFKPSAINIQDLSNTIKLARLTEKMIWWPTIVIQFIANGLGIDNSDISSTPDES